MDTSFIDLIFDRRAGIGSGLISALPLFFSAAPLKYGMGTGLLFDPIDSSSSAL